MMYIIAGKYRRRRLKHPKDRTFRPTKSVVREAIFNILGSRINGASFVDLCSGSGAVGIEAESRGAGNVICVDRDPKYLIQNKQALNLDIDIVRMDALKYIKRMAPVDILYFDPIWAESHIYEQAFKLLLPNVLKTEGSETQGHPGLLCQKLTPNGVLLIEHDSRYKLPEIGIKLVQKQYQYGNSMLSVIKNTIHERDAIK
jgi:16S rRNA (guanine966-N2)-methyltransferase